ncbi:MAG: restriction endonuclease subunit S [Actinomycetaceae bacterium]|nr:restriction endonuclease subunit S [Actinomycetaceae bacterium]
MKTLLKSLRELEAAGRWDIDFHLPPEGIKKFPKHLLQRIDAIADVVKEKRDPTAEPDAVFQYVDISSIDVATGEIANPQDLEGHEAPSRARKVIHAFDVIVSTCRPTRGAIAVVPPKLHGQIASTAFSVLRAHANVNPFYLHFAIRLPSTLEQFRKWSTGSSYPAILDSDVKKTLIPVPPSSVQDEIAIKVISALQERSMNICAANTAWNNALSTITASLTGEKEHQMEPSQELPNFSAFTIAEIRDVLSKLPPTSTANVALEVGYGSDLFGN